MSGIKTPAQDPVLLNDDFLKIHIKHLATNKTVKFKGWVTDFSDTFNSSWNEQTVYGRMDPLATFQNTSRTISMGFAVVSKNLSEAKTNLAQINRLIEFLYPVYNSGERTNQNTLKAAPLLGLRWTNLVMNSDTGKELIGWIDGLDYSPDISAGSFLDGSSNPDMTGGIPPIEDLSQAELDDFEAGPDASGTKQIVPMRNTKSMIPKQVSLSFTFHVVHTHLMGWTPEKIFGNSSVDFKFPNNQSLVYTSTQTIATITDQTGNEVQSVENSSLTEANETDVLGNTGGS